MIKLCNSVLSLIQMESDTRNSEFLSMDLSTANKSCAIELTGLTNKEACQLFVELYYARIKTEAYYLQLAKTLSEEDQHNLRKVVAEISLKNLQVFAILKSQLSELFFSRIETSCLSSMIGQNWTLHKENVTSTSWI